MDTSAEINFVNEKFRKTKKKWELNLLHWNQLYFFCSRSLLRMIEKIFLFERNNDVTNEILKILKMIKKR